MPTHLSPEIFQATLTANDLATFNAKVRGAGGIFVTNSLYSLIGEGVSDGSMLGFYDRNELMNAALRGIVTVTLTGAGSFTNTVAEINKMFAGGGPVTGNTFFIISGTDATTTQLVVHVDMRSNVSNFSSAQWQPFVQYRIIGQPTYFKTIVVEVSTDNATWYKPASGAWQTADFIADSTASSLWVGGNASPAIPAATWRYVRFTFTVRTEDAAYGSKAFIWIQQLGLRHRGSPYARQFMSTSGDTVYGNIDIKTLGTATSVINLNGTTGNVDAETFTGDGSGLINNAPPPLATQWKWSAILNG